MIIGYARVSTRSQDYALQEQALRAAGCTRIFAEKASAKSDKRPQLQKLRNAVQPGDVIVVTRLDRLARSTRDLLNLVHEFSESGVGFRSIADTWCDTTTPHGRLMLTIMAGLAEFERSLILARTEAGIARARDLGKQFGRPVKLNPKQRIMIAERYAKGETMAALATEFSVTQPTIWRALKATAA